jgi:soluble lytic murein transglycosylase
MNDRELLAAAQRACDREVWDRCINTSDRTRVEIDLLQRFPTPLRREVLAAAREAGVDPAFVYGLIRQESRFIMDARSGVGASGLMQLMPATARWTARKIGIEYRPSMINELEINLRLGTSYLRMVLDAAAYNAGPNRPRRWREGPTLDAAAWTEGIPFNETRDYVKKVLSNAVLYSAVLGGLPPQAPPRGATSPPPPGGAATPLPTAIAPTTPATAASGPAAGTAPTGAATAPAATPTAPTLIAMPAALRESTSIRQRLGRPIGPREASAGEPDRSLP